LKQAFTILIADRNPNVRELLKRELVAEGYRVHLARSGREVLNFMDDATGSDEVSGSPDLVIMDPDLPDMEEFSLLEVMRQRRPELPVVIHTFLAEYINHPIVLSSAAVVEKDGRHVDRLKDAVHEVLNRIYPL
jgi:CheY-like chemotaxis protein